MIDPDNGLPPSPNHVAMATGSSVDRITPVDSIDTLRQALQSTAGVVIPWGGGNGQMTGLALAIPVDVIDMRPFQGLASYDVDDMTVSVWSGTRLIDLQAALAENNQFLPIDPSYPVSATLGGIVAAAASGYMVNGYGGVRDQLLGVEGMDRAGTLIHGGGKVVKNVAGYDLPKLMAGSEGTLAILTKVTLRVAPKPEARASVVSRGDVQTLCTWVLELRAAMDPVIAVVVCRPTDEQDYCTLIFHGSRESVQAAAFGAANHRKLGITSQAYEGEYSPDPVEGDLHFKVMVLPTMTGPLAAKIQSLVQASGGTVTVLPFSGCIHVHWESEPDNATGFVSHLVQLSELSRGTWQLESSSVGLRRDAFRGPPVTDRHLSLLEGVKKAFDPDYLLVPHRSPKRT